MTLELRIPPETEAKLRECAAASGQDVEAFVLEALADKLAEIEPPKAPRPDHTEWSQKLRVCIDLHPATNHFTDDSRESIYSGRGE